MTSRARHRLVDTDGDLGTLFRKKSNNKCDIVRIEFEQFDLQIFCNSPAIAKKLRDDLRKIDALQECEILLDTAIITIPKPPNDDLWALLAATKGLENIKNTAELLRVIVNAAEKSAQHSAPAAAPAAAP